MSQLLWYLKIWYQLNNPHWDVQKGPTTSAGAGAGGWASAHRDLCCFPARWMEHHLLSLNFPESVQWTIIFTLVRQLYFATVPAEKYKTVIIISALVKLQRKRSTTETSCTLYSQELQVGGQIKGMKMRDTLDLQIHISKKASPKFEDPFILTNQAGR